MDALTRVPVPVNEPVLTYAPGSAERAALEVRLAELASAAPVALDAWIGGERRPGKGEKLEVRMPSDHAHVLGTLRAATQADARAAVDAALAAAPAWAEMPFDQRAAVFLRAADLIAGSMLVFFLPHRRVWVRIRPDGGNASSIELAAPLKRDPAFEPAFADLVHRLSADS